MKDLQPQSIELVIFPPAISCSTIATWNCFKVKLGFQQVIFILKYSVANLKTTNMEVIRYKKRMFWRMPGTW